MNLATLLALTLTATGATTEFTFTHDADDAPFRDSIESATPYDFYFDTTCKLSVAKDVPFPEGQFQISISPPGPFAPFYRNGYIWRRSQIAVLMPGPAVPNEYPIAKVDENRRSSKRSYIEDQTTFFTKAGGTSRLTLKEATRLWGTPRHSNGFYTFDAHNSHHGETNIYHLDFCFGKDSFVKTYRLRGTGITGEYWVKDKYDPVKGCILVGVTNYTSEAEDDATLKPAQSKQKQITLKCSEGIAALTLHIRDGLGFIEAADARYEKDDRARPQWFDTEFVPEMQYSASGKIYEKPTLKALSQWWGSPRRYNDSFYTFDVTCKYEGEPNIFHIDVKCDDKLKIVNSRLRGPGIGAGKWAVNLDQHH